MFKDNNEDLEELLAALEELPDGPEFLRCDNCHKLIGVGDWITGENENGPFEQCPHCGKIKTIKLIPLGPNYWIH